MTNLSDHPIRVVVLCDELRREELSRCLEGYQLGMCASERELAGLLASGGADVIVICSVSLPQSLVAESAGPALIWLAEVAEEAVVDAVLSPQVKPGELRECVQLLGEQSILEHRAEQLGARFAAARARYGWRGGQRRETWPRLRAMASTDPVTGVFARRYLDEVLRREFGAAQAAAQPLSLLIVDLDNFKQVNDLSGHLAGDRVLNLVAGRMKAALRQSDSVCRFGGDEFAIVLPGANSGTAMLIAERLRLAVSQDAYPAGDRTYAISCSIGIASVPGSGATSAAELVHQADLALLAAKRQGGNAVSLSPVLP